MTQLLKGVELRKQAENNIKNKADNDKVLLEQLVKYGIDKLFNSLTIEKLNLEFQEISKNINTLEDLSFIKYSRIDLPENMVNITENLKNYIKQYDTIFYDLAKLTKFDNSPSLNLHPFIKTLFDNEFSLLLHFRINNLSHAGYASKYYISLRLEIIPCTPIQGITYPNMLNDETNYTCENYLYSQVIDENGVSSF